MKLPHFAKSVLIIAVLYLAAWSLTVAIKWRSEPMIEAMDFNAQGFVWVEHVEFDSQWAGSTGNAGGGWCRGGEYIRPRELGPPKINRRASNSPMPLPKRALFQWFNFSQQRYYEALIDDPSMPQRAKEFAFSLRDWRRFKFSLVYDFSENGKVRLWLYGTDYKAPITIPEDKWVYTPLGTPQGFEIDGDPKNSRTEPSRPGRNAEYPCSLTPACGHATQARENSLLSTSSQLDRRQPMSSDSAKFLKELQAAISHIPNTPNPAVLPCAGPRLYIGIFSTARATKECLTRGKATLIKRG